MADIFNDQRKFMKACGQSVDKFNGPQFDMYCALINEEVGELHTALETLDVENDVNILDALIDILVVTTGAIHSAGFDAEGAWKEVMRSNFDKIDPTTGQVRKREDGKVLKPDNWEPPRLAKFTGSST